MYTTVVGLEKLIQTPSKYFWIVIVLICEKVTETLVPIVKYMGEKLFKNFHQEAYERESWSKKANDTAHRALRNSFKIFC